jgi:putative transposase
MFVKAIGLSTKTWYSKTKEIPESDYWVKDELILPILEDMPFYGYRKVTKELKNQGWSINSKKVRRIMKHFKLFKKRKKFKPQTTDSRHNMHVYPNLIRGIVPDHPNHIWSVDITYIKLTKGFCYLAAIIDIFTRNIRGWAIMTHMDATLPIAALEQALSNHDAPEYHHSDRGSQYCSSAYTSVLKEHDIQISMSAKGTPTNNPYIERFFRTLKVEEVTMRDYETIGQAKQHIQEFIDVVYTKKRLHASLDYITPDEFEKRWDYYLVDPSHNQSNTYQQLIMA